ncbi:cullin-3a-related [Anaeramoeba flamelloides]|uniref:Cullin-3a-related n=1 Tax=Anaeramoeba flamelloides TaxID=1746091 RepID=A0ABQ8YN94_9EUKA|nr:cullin-3a-related [Anaeramoeba flamelloides]
MSKKKGKLGFPSFLEQNNMDKKQLERSWHLIRKAFQKIYKFKSATLSYEEIYRTTYNLVVGKQAELLYTRISELIEEQAQNCSKLICELTEERMLIETCNSWVNYQLQHQMIHDLFLYLDRSYSQKKNKKKIYQLAMEHWRTKVLQKPKTKDKLCSLILQSITLERGGGKIDQDLLKKLSQMYASVSEKELDFYVNDLEKYFLTETAIYYQKESQTFLQENPCGTYLFHCNTRLFEENKRITHYFDPTTREKLIKVCEEELLSKHLDTLIGMDTGCLQMIKQDKYDELKLMYSLLTRVPRGSESILNIFIQYVKSLGFDIVKEKSINKQDPTSLIDKIIGLFTRFEKLLVQSFNNDRGYSIKLNKAFESFINENEKLPEYLSRYIDKRLRMGFKGYNENEINLTMDRVILVFNFISDKDIFKKFYEHYLAKRLLSGKNYINDYERQMISKIKRECGTQFTSKMEGMFRDMGLSNDVTNNFKEHLEDLKGNDKSLEETLSKIEINIKVLAQGHWPTFPSQSCILNTDLQSLTNLFENFYLGMHTGRRIIWQYNIGNSELQFNMKKKRYQLIVSTHQMMILTSFNHAKQNSIHQLHQSTNIPFFELRRALHALSSGRTKILIKDGEPNETSDKDNFSINLQFKSKLRRVKVPTVLRTEAEPERKKTRQRVEEDRKLLIDAAVVRVMKARKTLYHNDLIVEVTKQLTSIFHPKINMIKQRIENLIEREYLARFEEDRRKYKYLA